MTNKENYLRQLFRLSLTLVITSLVGCAYQLRSSDQWPPALSSIDLKTDGLPADAQSMIRQFLKSMHVHQNQSAPYQLVVSNYTYSQSQPTSINSSVPSTISFSVSMTIAILSKNKKTCIPPFSVASSFSELVPGSVLATRSADPDIQARLLENITQSIYSNLTSDDFQSKLNSPHCKSDMKEMTATSKAKHVKHKQSDSSE